MAHHDATSLNPLHKRRVRAGGWSLGLMLALGGGGGWAQTAAEYGNVAASQGGASAAAPLKLAKASPEANAARTPPSRAEGPSCSGDVGQPTVVSVAAGKSTLLRLPEPVTRRSLGDASVVEARLVSAQSLYVLGVKNGSTNMILQGKSGKCVIVDVVVGFDTAGLRAKISELLPNETGVKVSSASDSLVLSGVASDALNANQVVALANAYVRTTSGVSGASGQSTPAPAASGVGVAQGGVVVSPRVVNMMSVAAPQQVMLDVKVAEVSKTILDKLGAKVGYAGTGGGAMYSILSDFLFGTTGGALGGVSTSNPNRLFQFDGENKDAFVKVLAEPSIMAISGQEGSFLAGGKLFIPVSQTGALGGASTITLEEKEFGIGLRFTPTVLSGGRINLKVAPEVSDVNPDGIGVSVNTGLLSGTSVLPSINTRRATTTVQLMDGQTFAIGGLIKNNTTTNIKAYPWLGEIPVLGALFRSTQFQSDRTELLFVITPHLVKPLPADYRLPTDSYIEPGRGRLFINGKLEGDPDDVPALQQRNAIPAPDVQAPVSDAKPAGGFEVK